MVCRRRISVAFLALLIAGCGTDSPPADSDATIDVTTRRDTSTDVAPRGDAGAQPDAADLDDNCSPLSGEVTREGHPSDGWGWQKGSRLFPDDPVPANPTEGDFSPSIVETADGYRVYFSRKRGTGFSLWTATSSDGTTWSAASALPGFDADSYPAALSNGDAIDLWFGSGSFEFTTSRDGLTFGSRETVLRPSDVGGFANLSIIYPEVRRTDVGYRAWFTGFDGETLRLGTATSVDGVSWTPRTEPILERSGGSDFDSTSVGQSEVMQIGETWWMWYGGYDTSMTDPGPWRIGLARSSDGVAFTRTGVSIPLSETGDDMWSTRDPAVIATDSGFLMVYVGMSNDSHYRLLTARSTACP